MALVVGEPLVLLGPPGSLRPDHRIRVDGASVDITLEGRVLEISTDDLFVGTHGLQAECGGQVVLVRQFEIVAASNSNSAGGGMFVGLVLVVGSVFFLRPDRWRLFAPPLTD